METTIPQKVFDNFVVCPTTACWLWAGQIKENGYGTFHLFRGKKVYAHRYMYEAYRGPIPEGLQIDHLCRVKNCVNPWHLEPVTAAENLRRSRVARGVTRKVRVKTGHKKKDRCDCGSEYRIAPNGKKRCNPCSNRRQKEARKDPVKRERQYARSREWARKNKEYLAAYMADYHKRRKGVEGGWAR